MKTPPRVCCSSLRGYALAGLAIVLAFFAGKACAATAAIDATSIQQTIRGFGGATVFRPTEPLTTADLDTLFGNGTDQIGFSLLRVRVAPDDAWRALELENAKGAVARGAAVIATPWSPPASMKSNNSLIAGSLNASSYSAYANYLNDFAKYMASNGAGLYAISVQNEPDIEVTYESCDWTPSQMLDFCKNYAGAITATRVIAPESFQFRQNMSDPILNDVTAASNVSIIGGHIYGAGLVPYPLAAQKGKELWMTEHLDLSTDWAGALATGKEMHDCLAVANFSAYIWWYIKRYYGPLGEDGIITKRGYVMSQFSKFIRPGAVRVAATANPTTGVYVSAYKRDKLVIVAVNLGTSAVNQTFSLQGAAPLSFAAWATSASLNMAVQPALAVSGGSFTATLAPGSVTTFVGDLPIVAPTIIASPKGHTMEAGNTLVLEATTTGDFVSYQWMRDGAVLPGATSRMLTIANVQPGDAGSYTLSVSNSGGRVVSAAAVIAVAHTGDPGRLIGIATRSPVNLGDGVQIGGFVIEGSSPKPVLIRSTGPTLASVSTLAARDLLADPMIALHNQITHSVITSNDDWDATLASVFARCGLSPWPAGSKDSALALTLSPGAYAALVSGKSNGTGIALIEIYDAGTSGSESRLAGLSSRTQVGVGDNVQIAGLVIGGATARTMVIRASGPALARISGLTTTLVDPTIELYEQTTHTLIASSDDWDESLASHFDSVGEFPWHIGSKDAALVLTLDPGAYAVVVKGKDGGTGLAQVEVYAAP